MRRINQHTRTDTMATTPSIPNTLMAPKNGKLIIVIPHYWASGATIKEAKRNLKKLTNTTGPWVVYSIPEGCTTSICEITGSLRFTVDRTTRQAPVCIAASDAD